MTPETWAVIREDWHESIPAVLAGEDDAFYPINWAVDRKPPRTMKISFLYICASMGWDACEIKSRRRIEDLVRKRDAIGLALQRRHSNKTLCQLAAVLNRDDSSLRNLLQRARRKERDSAEFRDLVQQLECLI